MMLDERRSERGRVGFVHRAQVDGVGRWVEEELRFRDGSVGDGSRQSSGRRRTVQVDGRVLEETKDASGRERKRKRKEREREGERQTFERAVSVGMMGIEGGGSFPRKLSRQVS